MLVQESHSCFNIDFFNFFFFKALKSSENPREKERSAISQFWFECQKVKFEFGMKLELFEFGETRLINSRRTRRLRHTESAKGDFTNVNLNWTHNEVLNLEFCYFITI